LIFEQDFLFYSADIQYSSKYLEYINYVSYTLNSFGIKQAGKITKYHYKNTDSYDYKYASCAYIELLPIYKKWYPNCKKIFPKGIKLTPITLRQHYIGDGSLRNEKRVKPSIMLYTCGFLISDVERLIKQLIKLGFKTTRRPSKNIISISSHSTKDFLNYIGRCPVECYQYKWG